MKSNTYKVLFIIASIIIVVLAVKLFLTPKKVTNKATNQPTNIIDDAMVEAKKLAEKVDKKGLKTASFERQAEIIGNGDISHLPVSQSVLDSLMLDNLDKTKKYQSAVAINASLEAKNLRATKVIDSLKNASFVYKDEFVNARFTPDSLGGKFDIGWHVNLVKHDYRKRKGILSPYRYYTDILSPDPRITINGLKQLTIEPPAGKAKIGFGVTAGYGVQLSRENQLTYGLQLTAGLQYRF